MQKVNLPHHHNEKNIDKILEGMPNPEHFQLVAEDFKLLGDMSRVRIFWLLCHCEECVTNISEIVGMSNPAVAHHLKQLKLGGLIESRRDGKEVCYKAKNSNDAQTMHLIIEKLLEMNCPDDVKQ